MTGTLTTSRNDHQTTSPPSRRSSSRTLLSSIGWASTAIQVHLTRWHVGLASGVPSGALLVSNHHNTVQTRLGAPDLTRAALKFADVRAALRHHELLKRLSR